MSNWHIVLYASDSLARYCETEYGDEKHALKRAKTYIEGAFGVIRSDYSNVPDHTVDVDVATETVPAPQEAIRPDFTATHPCLDPTFEASYDNLVQWFQDWTACNGRPRGTHCTALVTNGDTDSGGIGQTAQDYNHAGASTGRFIGDLPSSYDRYGPKYPDTDNAHDAMGTLIHEIGHALQSFNQDADGDGVVQHDVGYYDRGTDSMTPMGIKNSINECGDSNGNASNVELCWAECAVQHWDHDNDGDPTT